MEGIVIINKPSGMTSFDVIRVLRKNLKERRIGHTGTLDPLAEGVLIVCVGRATKLAQEIEGFEKEYIAEFRLGFKTDTYDIEGKIIATSDNKRVSYQELSDVIERFKGKISQKPPMYSAIKVDGKKLYELARAGMEIERKSREVEIKRLEILEFEEDRVKILCKVSKGTYIRSLIDDIGEELKTYATMISLKRTKVGNTQIENSYTLDEISNLVEREDNRFLISVEDYFNYDKVKIESDKGLNLFKNGQHAKIQVKDGFYRVYSNRQFIGLGVAKNGYLKGYKYF